MQQSFESAALSLRSNARVIYTRPPLFFQPKNCSLPGQNCSLSAHSPAASPISQSHARRTLLPSLPGSTIAGASATHPSAPTKKSTDSVPVPFSSRESQKLSTSARLLMAQPQADRGREQTSEVLFAAGARLDHCCRSALRASVIPTRPFLRQLRTRLRAGFRKSDSLTGALDASLPIIHVHWLKPTVVITSRHNARSSSPIGIRVDSA